MSTVFTNNRITLSFTEGVGTQVLSEEGFVPFKKLGTTDKDVVRHLLDFCPTCPSAITDEVYGLETLSEPVEYADFDIEEVLHVHP